MGSLGIELHDGRAFAVEEDHALHACNRVGVGVEPVSPSAAMLWLLQERHCIDKGLALGG